MKCRKCGHRTCGANALRNMAKHHRKKHPKRRKSGLVKKLRQAHTAQRLGFTYNEVVALKKLLKVIK